MKVYTEMIISMVTGEVLSEKSFDYDGAIAYCKGATDDQKSLGQEQMALFNEVAGHYSDVFLNAQNIMASLKAAWQPVVNRGINQYGFSLPEDSALRSSATTNIGNQYKNAAAASGERMAAVGGGNVALPSGVENAAKRNLAVEAAQADANAQLGITEKGFDVGRENFLNASKIMASAPGELFNPATAASEAATGAGTAASKTQSEISEEEAAASPWSVVGGILGGAASSFVGGLSSSMFRPKAPPSSSVGANGPGIQEGGGIGS